MTTGHSDRPHAKYGASSASRWMNCYGSTALLAAVPNRPSSKWAEDGTKAHELLDHALQHKDRDAKLAWIGWHPQGFGEPDTEELERIQSVQLALDYIWSLIDYDPNCIVLHEEYSLLQDNPSVGGTFDVAVYWPRENVLHLPDLKHGAGIVVDVENNPQLFMYDALVLRKLLQLGHPVPQYICNTIIQPRIPHKDGYIRSQWIEPGALGAFFVEAMTAVELNEKPGAQLKVGKYCRLCDANSICPAYEASLLSRAQLAFSNTNTLALPDVKTLDIARLAAIKRVATELRGWLEAVEEEVLTAARGGVDVTPYGLKLVEGYPKRVYHGEASEVAAKLAKLTGKSMDEVWPRKLMGITEAEKLVKAELRKTAQKGELEEATRKALAELTTKTPKGSLTLVELSDPRPAQGITGRIFANADLIPPPPKG